MEEIVVWGLGNHGIRFYLSSSSRIVAFIDANVSKNMSSFDNIPIYSPAKSKIIIRNYYVVVASSEDIYWEIRRELIEMGMTEFEHFCYYKLYKKKVAVVYGNCHSVIVQNGLKLSGSFCSEYGLYPMKPINVLYKESDDLLDDNIFMNCDLFIHQSIRKNNRYGYEFSSEAIMSKLTTKCKILSFPNLYGLPKCFYPMNVFMDHKGELSNPFEKFSCFSFRDVFIEKMFFLGYSESQIASLICESNYDDDKLKQGFFQFMNKLEYREKEWDIKIAEWINSNYQKNQLFCDPNHPNSFVMIYIIKKLYEILGIDDVDDDYLNEMVPCMDSVELPVYGCVLKALDMKWKPSKLLRKYSRNSLSEVAITYEEYVHQYLIWYHQYIKKDNSFTNSLNVFSQD